MTNQPYLYKYRAEAIVYNIQTKLSVHLSDDLRHDIYTNVMHAVLEEAELARSGADYWREEYADLKAKRYPLKWNELRIRIARAHKPEYDEVLEWMRKLDEGESIR
jgi:hypothetical protein